MVSINEDKTLFITANHAFSDLNQNRTETCVIIPPFSKCPYEVSQDDLKSYIGLTNFKRLEEQDICVFEIETPEALYIQKPTPFPLSFNFKVGDEVCTIGYPFIGYTGKITNGRRDMRFIERLTYAHLSAIYPENETFVLEFDNYIGPGNSGGPLINIRNGSVIGVVTSSRTEGEYYSVTTFSHASCIIELERARDDFPDLPTIVTETKS